MARCFPVQGSWKGGGLYLVVVVVMFGVIVFLLFRGRTPGPREATPGCAGSPEPAVWPPTRIAARVAAEPGPAPAPPGQPLHGVAQPAGRSGRAAAEAAIRRRWTDSVKPARSSRLATDSIKCSRCP